ncbi:MAG: peptide chain release factor N(5)-glutamine methyltransferase [Anaerolineae bacterium]|nr:peptide chain release factor N(5)-glutamine methyltransferase [Anaerolineae bacterium]
MVDHPLPATIRQALDAARRCDPERVSPGVAQAVLAHITGKGKAWLLAFGEAPLAPVDAALYIDMLERLNAGEPLPHLLGEREFYGYPFTVTPDVLIPRPETESLVDLALRWCREQGMSAPRLVDVGTGSGAIALTLALELPDAEVTGIEISPEALAIARVNAERHGLAGRVSLCEDSLLDTEPGPFDIIIANLPYINSEEIEALEVGRWEPRVALDGGTDGLMLIRALLEQAPSRLARPGLLLLEMGHDQGQHVCELCQERFPAGQVTLHRDLAQLDRIVEVRLPA